MLRRVVIAVGIVASLLALGTLQQASGAVPHPISVRPSVASPTIGFVYGSGMTDSGPGITVYAQHADGSLTHVQDVGDGDALHATAIVHLKSGVVLYDLTRNGMFGFKVDQSTGKLTQLKLPAPTVALNYFNGLAVYDPLAHGLPGQPMLVTGACGTATTDLSCPFRYAVFPVDPVTGMTTAGTYGPAGTVRLTTGIVGDGLGHFAFGAASANQTASVQFAKASVAGSATSLVNAGAHTLADNAVGQGPTPQTMGSTIVITRNNMVDFPAWPLAAFTGNPGGWVAYGFGSSTAAPFESQVNADITASAQGVKSVWVAEDSGNLPAGQCALESFGTLNPGLGGVRTMFPCTGQIANYVPSIFEQAGYMYVGLYGDHSLGFHDVGAASMAPTAQKKIPNGTQIYSWAGFLLSRPAVAVAPHLSLKVGIPVTIQCPQTCSGTSSATIKVGASKIFLKTATLTFKPHSPGTFTVKLVISKSLRTAVTAGLKKKSKVTVVTTSKVKSGTQSVTVLKTSLMGA